MKFQEYIQLIQTRNNLFLHGPGGTGKTYTIRKIHNTFKETRQIMVVAPTGRAAVNLELDAQTINRAFGIPPLSEDMTDEELISLSRRCGKKKMGMNLDLLIIDEVSMVGRQLIKLVDYILQIIMKNSQPMGGVQLIISGDFYQLPPVKDENCFDSDVWDLLNFKLIKFKESKRYDDERTFLFLKNLRKNKLTPEDMELIESRRLAYINKEYRDLHITPVLLYATNKDADRFNDKKLREIDSPLLTYHAIDKQYIKPGPDSRVYQNMIPRILDDLAPALVEVKIGAKVMICKNIDPENKLVNGMMGIVKDIEEGIVTIEIEDGTEHHIPPCSFESKTKNFTCSRIQYPFRLAWAITIHKSQGGTLSSAVIKIEDIRNPGQAYVAFSRVRNIGRVYILGRIDYTKFTATSKLPKELS